MNLNAQPYKNEKIEITLDNTRKEFKNKNSTSGDNSDDLEALGSVSVQKLKEWLIKSYVDIEHLRNSINNDFVASSLTDKDVKYY